jgi:putative DNA primase/helicase
MSGRGKDEIAGEVKRSTRSARPKRKLSHTPDAAETILDGNHKKPTDPTALEILQSYPCTDSGNAELLARLNGGRLRFDHKQGRWLIWDSHCRRWKEDRQDVVYIYAKQAARYRAKTAASIDNDEVAGKVFKWAKTSENRFRIENALALAEKERPISDSGEGWDADPWLFGVGNGIIDLRTGKLRQEQRDDRIIKHSSVPFDPGAECPRFRQFLSQIFNEDVTLVDYIHRAIGYCLTGSVIEQCLFCCYGSGANGKSTMFTLLEHLFGDHAANLPFSALEMRNRNSNDLVNLVGIRFATASETNEGVRLNEARIKALTGGDPITARRLYHEAFTFNPTHKLWLAFNHKPVIADDSEGMWRRVRLIPFDRQFRGDEQDRTLVDTLKSEAPGILAWAVDGCIKWQRDRLGMPTAVAHATARYREESDHLASFIEECCVVDRCATVAVGDLWERYVRWTNENEEIVVNKKVFKGRMEHKGFHQQRKGHQGTRTWTGIGFADRQTGADDAFSKLLKDVPMIEPLPKGTSASVGLSAASGATTTMSVRP